MRRFAVLAVFFSLVLGARYPAHAEGIGCWLRCHCPPVIASAADLAKALRRCENPELNLLARGSGILTTYVFKYMGIQGWRDLHHRAGVHGTVVHASGSDDGLYTVDVQITELTMDGQPVQLSRDSFIRIEVFPSVKCACRPSASRDQIYVEGKLMWDGDGFLEIHP